MSAPIIYVIEPYGGSVRRHNSALPLLYPDDAAVTRGDGIFETFLVRGGEVHNVERHIARFENSARAMDLPEPLIENWLEATNLAIEEWGDAEGRCTWTYSRGRASTGHPTAWVTLEALDPTTIVQREQGVRCMTMERTWQLPSALAAKTINYAATMAALRHAERHGFDDVIFLDGEGHLLEGSRSTVIAVKGMKMRTPAAEGIIPGTTQKAIFAAAEEQGYSCKAKVMDVDYLKTADSVWLVSSTRGPVRVRRIDGRKMPAPANEAQVRELMLSSI